MADIAPLRGYRYNQEVVPDLAAVVTPPYDVISPAEQEMYHRRHPYNMVRLILGDNEPGDTEEHNWFTRAAEELRTWREQRILLRDPQPAVYDYEIDYSAPSDLTKTRHGFICLVRLQEFAHGSIRPHEQTFAAIKSERLKPHVRLQRQPQPDFCPLLRPCRTRPRTASGWGGRRGRSWPSPTRRESGTACGG